MTMFIVDFDKLHFRELLEILHEWTRDVIERAVRLALPHQINLRHAVSKGEFAITGETIEHQGESLIALDITRTFEEFIEDSAQ